MVRKFKFVFEYISQQRQGIAFIVLLTLCSSALAALTPWPMKILVDYALGELTIPSWFVAQFARAALSATPVLLVITAAILSLLLFALSSVLNAGLSLLWSKTGQQMVYQLSADVLERLQRQSLLFHYRHHVGDLLNRLSTDTYCIYTLAELFFVAPLRHLLTLASIGAVAWALDPNLTMLAVVLTPLMAASALYFGNRLRTHARLAREAQSKLATFIHQSLSVIPLIQAFGTVDRNHDNFHALAERAIIRSQNRILENQFYATINGLITTCGMALVIYYGSLRVLSGASTVGSLLVFIAYVGPLQNAFRGLFSIYGRFKVAEANLDRLLELTDSTDQFVDEGDMELILPSGAQGAHIRLQDVSFGYEPKRPVLHAINMEAKPGEVIALVGSTGAGKSTISSLILRFFDPCEGRIFLDDVDTRRFTVASLRHQISLVLQETYLLPITIADNIAYGRPDASIAEITNAARAAGIHETIIQLPDGYDTVLSERGANLSGGQRQRLSIARALLKDSPVLILDEPTSALDAETEAQIIDSLDRLMKNRTTIVIAHRLSTIQKADRIYVIESGRVIESGSYTSLMSRRGAYYKLHQANEKRHLGLTSEACNNVDEAVGEQQLQPETIESQPSPNNSELIQIES